ncbi:V-type ATP synthase subunit I [Treponema parvum]|uniref:V-type ATP synthase subunit I n=1 Tax=Treponema parvum TaxID=138851 RepID=UPI001AEC0605|nr:V-type ATPase 116kDa subunit family protein [Treponema parvum]QTQ16709.1 ATPase [Treponema parvum]
MARTTQMRLVELMVLKQDITRIIEFLGKRAVFQFENQISSYENSPDENTKNDKEHEIFSSLQQCRAYLNIQDRSDVQDCSLPDRDDYDKAQNFLSAVDELKSREKEVTENARHVKEAYREALAFSNLKASYSDLEHLSFLTLRIGKIDPSLVDELKFAVGDRAAIIQLGDDKSRILAASSKKGRFALDSELKRHGFVEMEIPKDFKGIPDDVLEGLKTKSAEAENQLAAVSEERKNFTDTHKDLLLHLLGVFSIAKQVREMENKLEATHMVYRITGWIPAYATQQIMHDLDVLTEGRIAIREYKPSEIPAVISGRQQVPVQLKHGKLVGAFGRMIFSYGSPVYGSVDPTPFVALFFTLLFGIMFGDLGQGLVFLLFGLLLAKKIVKVGGWNKFAPVFMAIGVSSSIMGLLTGEFFSNETLLEPFAHYVTGLFGTPRSPILPMRPASDPQSIKNMFMFFGFSIAVGFVINTCGLIINIINQFNRKHWGKALFGKTGLSGALFFWYVIVFAVRLASFGHVPEIYDWVIIGLTLFGAAYGEILERIIEGRRPVFENGFGAALIAGLVEVIEVISNYLSNTISFMRVGAFALSHAVLGYIINTMTHLAGGAGGIAILILGNATVIVLEGMIVAIQVIRLQYYEFFSKFFNETGREFKPFAFYYT